MTDSPAQPTVVVWDVGRVLVEWDLALLYRDAIPDAAARARFVAEVVSEEWHGQHDAGVPWSDMVPARIAQFPQHAALIARYASHWMDSIPGPVAGTHDLVRRLGARTVPQYAITNFGVDAWALFRPTFPILDHCRDIVVSGAERLIKPDPAIFELAAQRFGQTPETMLFIDDNAANIATARALGWHTHHFTQGAAALEADLVGYGLL
ncbi:MULTISPECIES: HAD family phosphatase [unclassified Novosphingobium]|uniref:HAD family hydrolase n=1 Tax=unclassified Novosphingobium TaxID=2644732 RepID=UPI001447A31C|nr:MULTISPECIES: HAD family phosphatase [unclassified Novosphingobium]NKJ44966.1 2-haloacid dehalogenase [Novosphingobium sp. SG720]NMN07384.1 2-haloacid dehalogenase [Novosphingobium sp. SG919]NMN89709.1 2-haloacid dehalogenase [Novosphingobium sp. SG916]